MTEKMPNRLINEKSPYLLQHAYNPVQWYSWGEEAFKKAKNEDKPIFLSIGYSTCHWCHVMETESFEDKEVAEMLNEHFVSIKVDREERPDIDSIYMNVCQMLTGSGGWPLTIVMTPEQKPFFAGTYFPKSNRRGMPGLMYILKQLSDVWSSNKNDLIKSAQSITEAMGGSKERDIQAASDDEIFNQTLTDEAFEALRNGYDSHYGGFSSAPKFPSPHVLYFLLRYYKITGNAMALEMTEKTLTSMYRGGIYDHIGYGFSRYSTDKKWLVPHFEKMLYDNALLAIAYLEAYQLTRKNIYADIAEQIFTYVLRDMTSEDFGFYSAEDADSEGVEGKFYVWSPDEIKNILGNEAGEKFCKYYSITPEGNFDGKSIPNLIESSAIPNNMSEADDVIPSKDIELIRDCINKLYEVRNKRVHPHKDDKILTGWNGLMTAAFAIGGRVLGKSQYIDAAEKNISFIYSKLIGDDGRLMARFRDNQASFPAYAEDFAYVTWAFIELYEASYKREYLSKAVELMGELYKYFHDEKAGGMFVYGSDSEMLISRPKEIYDGAVPSANSVTALNLLRLSMLTDSTEFNEKAMNLQKAFINDIKDYPKGYTFFLISLLYLQAPERIRKIVIAGNKNDENVKSMLELIQNEFSPFTAVLFSEDDENSPYHIKNYNSINSKGTAYICENYNCKPPVTDLEEFKKLIGV